MTYTFTTPAYANSADFTPCPPGVWPARLYRLIDLGTQAENFEGRTAERRKILLSFEILDPDVTGDDGRPMTCHRRFTWSLHERAALRPFLSSWRGRPLTEAEAGAFDISKLLDVPCLLNVTNVERAGRLRAEIASITPLPKGMTARPGRNPTVMFHTEHPDLAVLDGLGRTLRETIELSPEFRRAMGGGAATPRTTTGPRTSTTPAPQPPAQPNPYAALRAEAGYRRAAPPVPPPLPPAMDSDFDDDVPF
jgi:hypothetical protein